MDATQVAAMLDLAQHLTALGFEGLGEAVYDYTANETERATWSSAAAFLAAVRRDVWGGFEQVGEPSERHVYEDAAREIDHVVALLRAVR